jgi:DNA invertase Pin-like site-specific DNA recombinase
MPTALSGLANFERELILARTSDDRASAKARDVQFGRRPKLSTSGRKLSSDSRKARHSRFGAERQRDPGNVSRWKG